MDIMSESTKRCMGAREFSFHFQLNLEVHGACNVSYKPKSRTSGILKMRIMYIEIVKIRKINISDVYSI